MSAAEAKVVIVGGGIGGLACAHRLVRSVGEHTRVVLVEPREVFEFAPDYLWVLAGTRRPRQLTRPMSRMVPRGVEHVVGSVTAFAPDRQEVVTTAGELHYERLVVALGATTHPEALDGFAEGAHDLYSAAGASDGHEALSTIRKGRLVVMVSSMPFKCPAAPYEAAFIAEAMLRKRGVRDAVSVEVVTPEPLPMPPAGPALGHRVAAMLADRNIVYRPGTSVESVDPKDRVLRTADGSTIDYDVLLGVPPHRPPAVVAASPLAGPNGYVAVDPGTLASNQERVYAIGDVAAVAIPDGKFLPKAGVFAHAEAGIVAERIADELGGRAPRREFDGHGSCFLELGGGRAARASGNFASSPPDMRMNRPGWWWHVAKIGVEQYWLHPKLWRFG